MTLTVAGEKNEASSDTWIEFDKVELSDHGDLHRVEAVLGARFPGINKKLGDFNFKRHYGAEVKEIKRSGQPTPTTFEKVDQTFIIAWLNCELNHNLPNFKIIHYFYEKTHCT